MSAPERTPRSRLRSEQRYIKLSALLYVLLVTCTVMGDAVVLRRRFSSIDTLAKVFSMGIIPVAVLKLLIFTDALSLRRYGYYLALMLAPLFGALLYSIGVWIYRLDDLSMMTRGYRKLLFQVINAFVALSAIILFKRKAINYTFYGLILGNALMAIITLPSYGLGPAIQSVVSAVSGGDTVSKGFMAVMEVNDLTFAIGYLVTFYLVFEKRSLLKYACVAVGLLFFIIGFKRIAIPAFFLSILFGWWLRRLPQKRAKKQVMYIGAVCVAACFGYVYLLKSGLFVALLNRFGIEAMGRDTMLRVIEPVYEISPFFMGYGFETASLLLELRSDGELLALHNSILTTYIEFGFLGFFCWYIYYCLFTPHALNKYCGVDSSIAYITVFLFMFITYATDNTFFYYWDSYVLRLVPFALCEVPPPSAKAAPVRMQRRLRG